ncbi:cytochrome c-type biogenesis protein [Cucumibacter marinus]|uniref:cytochrome c-type biogenesis protein n=1 Tax=Cucumibacter marinus TaxID=1121252 RepID=UPI000425E1E0|nr:cytochrome c-type biogenesis protein [Cucumibacter marinus]
MRRFALILLVMVALVTPVLAVQPDEMLDDPVLEQRAREISSGLRCLVCQNQSIDDSDADLARDLRLLVRERLVEGDTNKEVVDYVVDRYGEFVLLRPVFDMRTLALWLAAPVLFLVGVIAVLIRSRRRKQRTGSELTADEQAAIDAMLSDGGPDADLTTPPRKD